MHNTAHQDSFQRQLRQETQERKRLEAYVAVLQGQLESVLAEKPIALQLSRNQESNSTCQSEKWDASAKVGGCLPGKELQENHSAGIRPTFHQQSSYLSGSSESFKALANSEQHRHGMEVTETVDSFPMEHYNQMLETEIREKKLPTTIRQIIQKALSTQKHFDSSHQGLCTSDAALEQLLGRFEQCVTSVVEDQMLCYEIAMRIASAVGINLNASLANEDKVCKELLVKVTEQCRALSNRVFELEVNNLTLEEENDQLKRDNVVVRKSSETAKLKEVALKNNIYELTTKNAQLERELKELRRECDAKSYLPETNENTLMEETAQIIYSEQSPVERFQQQLSTAKLTIEHLQSRIKELQKQQIVKKEECQQFDQEVTEVDSPVVEDGCTKRVFVRTKKAAIAHVPQQVIQEGGKQPDHQPTDQFSCQPVLEDSLQDKLNQLAELQSKKKELRQESRIKSQSSIASYYSQRPPSNLAGPSKHIPFVRKGTLMPGKIF